MPTATCVAATQQATTPTPPVNVTIRCRHHGAWGAAQVVSPAADRSYRQYLALQADGSGLVAWWNDGDSPPADRLSVGWRTRDALGSYGPLHRIAGGSDPTVLALGHGAFRLFWLVEATGDEHLRSALVVDGVAAPAVALGPPLNLYREGAAAAGGVGAASWLVYGSSGHPPRVLVARAHGRRVGLHTYPPGLSQAGFALSPDVTTTVDGAGDVILGIGGLRPSLAGFEAVAPHLVARRVPARVRRGRRALLTVTPADPFGPVRVRWLFGDGARAVGAAVHHRWQLAGRYTVTIVLTDASRLVRRIRVRVTVR